PWRRKRRRWPCGSRSCFASSRRSSVRRSSLRKQDLTEAAPVLPVVDLPHDEGHVGLLALTVGFTHRVLLFRGRGHFHAEDGSTAGRRWYTRRRGVTPGETAADRGRP